MRKLTIEIDDTLLPQLLELIDSLPGNKIKIRILEETTNSKLTYEEFEKKWAGLLSEEDIEDFTNKRIDHLMQKHK